MLSDFLLQQQYDQNDNWSIFFVNISSLSDQSSTTTLFEFENTLLEYNRDEVTQDEGEIKTDSETS